MGAVPSTLTDSMFIDAGANLKRASDIFRSWADSTSAVERSLELHIASLNVQLAFATIAHFLRSRQEEHYRAMKLYVDIVTRDLDTMRDEKDEAIKKSFAAVVKYLQIRAEMIDKRIAEEREADMLVAFKKIKVKEEIEDEKALAVRITDLQARVKALTTSSSRGGAYRFPRRFSRSYCRRTTCRRMGFTQRASCRPYKNCYRATRRRREA